MDSSSVISSSEYNKLHLSNITLLASIDCALALTTLVFNVRQVILSVDGFPEEKRTIFEASFFQFPGVDHTYGDHLHVVAAAVASVCLTLIQLVLACLVMVSLSNWEQQRTAQKSSRLTSAVWVLWSAALLTLLIVYASKIKRFKGFGDKFYLFMLVCEIILRLVIILYTTMFFMCPCCNIHH